MWLRDQDGRWQLVPEEDLAALPSADVTGRPPRGRLELVLVPPAGAELLPDDDVGGATPSPSPACPSPSQHTVTPNPMNGPPTTYAVCP